jgi:hypothetical protein
MNLNTNNILALVGKANKATRDSAATSSPITNPPIIWAPNRIGVWSNKIFLHFDLGRDIRDLGPFFFGIKQENDKARKK